MKKLFNQLPQEQLPIDFRQTIMQKIMLEAARTQKRNERRTFVAIVTASLLFLVLGGGALYLLGMPKISLPTLNIDSDVNFIPVLFIAILSVILLVADHLFRKSYYKKHKDS